MIRHRIDTGKGHKGFLVLKAANVSNLGHQLRAEGLPNAVHLHDNGIFRQHGSQTVHFSPVCFNGVRNAGELVCGLLHQQFCHLGAGNQCYGRLGKCVHLFGIALLENVAVPLAPFAVALCEGVQAVFSDTVRVPEGVGEVHPFLRTVLAYRTVKAFADAGEGLLLQGD